MALAELGRDRAWSFLREQWTQERVDLLTKRWADGHSARQIASELGGITRSAVIGKVHRLKLPQRETKVSAPQIPRRRQPFKPKLVREISPRRSDDDVWALKAALKTDELADLPADQSPHAVSLFDVQSSQCRWPMNDPGPGFLFCGAPQWGDHSYCARHFALARRSSKDTSEDLATKRAAIYRRNGFSGWTRSAVHSDPEAA